MAAFQDSDFFHAKRVWDLSVWILLDAIIRKGSLTAGCIECDWDPATASRKIAALEEELGVALLDRASKPVKPSPFLNHSLPNIRKAANALRKVFDAAQEEKTGGPLTTIRMSSWVGGLIHNLISLADEFSAQFPRIKVELIGQKPLEALKSGEIDAILTPLEMRKEDVDIYHIGRCFNFPVASKTYVEKHGLPKSPLELSGHRVLLFRKDDYSVADRLHKGNEIFDLDTGELLSVSGLDKKEKRVNYINLSFANLICS